MRTLPLFFFGCGGFGDRLPEAASGVSLADGEVPTYDNSVQAIVDAYCVDCHGETPKGDAPATFRLDVYESQRGKLGLYEMADRAVYRATATPGDPMPPLDYELALTEDEKTVLRRWYRAGAPRDAADLGTGDDTGGAQ